MAFYRELSQAFVEKLGEEYELGKLISVSGIAEGSVNSNYLVETNRSKCLLRVDEVKSEAEIRREIDLLSFLHRHSFPCPYPLQDSLGRYYRDYDQRYAAVFKYYEGRTVAVEDLGPTHLYAIGRMLAELHIIGKGYKKALENRFSFERIAELFKVVAAQLPAHFRRVVRALQDEIDYLGHYLDERLPKGVIHGDLFADNVVFRGGRLCALLDFEAACRGKFIFDLATAVNALCFVGEQYSLERFRHLTNGYESTRALSLAEWDAFPNELRYSALRFTVTRLNDFFLHPVDDGRRRSKDFREFFDRLCILRREKEGGMDLLLMAMATGYDYRKYQKVKSTEKLRA